MENIAIVTGGDSSEHDISLKSANNIKAFLDDSKYKGFLVLIKENNLYVVINKNKIEIDKSWFEGGKLNITNNCLDRHLKKINKKTAIKWIPNNPKEKTIDITYEELHLKVCKFSQIISLTQIPTHH